MLNSSIVRARIWAVTVVAATVGLLGAAQAQSVPALTLQVINNSSKWVYPVFSTGTSSVDEYMQVWWQGTKPGPYPRENQFRLYVNGLSGIAPGKSVSFTVPLYSQLVPTDQINPNLPNQFASWWGGGRLNIFASATKAATPPASLVAEYNYDQTLPAPTTIAGTPLPTCAACTVPLAIVADPAGLPNNDESQVVEFNLGAINEDAQPKQVVTDAVDYDVSAVNNVALPVAMEPLGLTSVGYVGSLASIDNFRNAMDSFRKLYKWPRYEYAGLPITKIPSPLEFTNSTKNIEQPYANEWRTKLTNQYVDCVNGTSNLSICPTIVEIDALMQANWSKYEGLVCDGTKVEYSTKLLIAHVYGWTPFTEGCSPTSNLFQDTPGYSADKGKRAAEVQAAFTAMQNSAGAVFNPYVALVHTSTYLNMPNVYAFSVDDGVGNIGIGSGATGLVVAVAGSKGLPNPDPYGDAVNVNFGGSPANHFKYYGVCTLSPTTKVNPSFQSFSVSPSSIPCTVSFLDSSDNLYTTTLQNQPNPNYPPLDANGNPTAANYAQMSCTGAPKKNWCKAAFAYYNPASGQNFVITRGPDQ